MMAKALLPEHIHPLVPVPTALQPKGTLNEKIECVLFDIYGTLFISRSGDISLAKDTPQRTTKLARLIHKFGIDLTPGELLTHFFSKIEKTHEALKKKGIDYPEVQIDRIWMQVLKNNDADAVRAFALEFELIVNPVFPMPHLASLLSGCRERKLWMGIISNAQFYTPYLFQWFLDANLEALGFCTDLVFFSYQFGYAKPSSFLFDLAALKLKEKGLREHAVLYVGNDMLNDIYPAAKTGFKTALFAGDLRSLRLRKDEAKCKHLSADIVITDLVQVLNYL
jgi:putative hydrolase of the HAD superfamily